ncbi:MAG: ParB/RepB/Spo0J family partition protein [Leptospirillia bacterium]
MTTTRQALGKGLGALLETVDAASGVLREIPVSDIHPNPYQPRMVFDDHDLKELSSSIRKQGVLQPVTVRNRAEGGYQLIAGERRWRAAKMAKLTYLPALVRASGDEESLELALVENIQRRDLSPMEAAQAYQRLMTEFGLTQEQVAQRVGKDRSSVANTTRLMNLPMEVQDHLQAERISFGHAKAMLGIDRPDEQVKLARRIILERLSVRQLEGIVARIRNGQKPPARPTKTAETTALETRLTEHLGTRVSVSDSKKSGKIEIRYGNPEDRERLLARLLSGDT